MKRKIFIITLFPEYFEPLINCGVVGQALRGERVDTENPLQFEINCLNPRDFTVNNYKGVDDTPFGGGAGMVIRADVLKKTLLEGVVQAHGYTDHRDLHVIYTSPRGQVWNDQSAKTFADTYFNPKHAGQDLVYICGRYEGVDERFLQLYVNEYFSIGDFVLSGGEIAVLTMLDSALRFAPAVLGNRVSFEDESFSQGLIEYPQYTKPRSFEGMDVPEVLMSGHHKNIKQFQHEQALAMTKKWRPDLYQNYLNKKA